MTPPPPLFDSKAEIAHEMTPLFMHNGPSLASSSEAQSLSSDETSPPAIFETSSNSIVNSSNSRKVLLTLTMAIFLVVGFVSFAPNKSNVSLPSPEPEIPLVALSNSFSYVPPLPFSKLDPISDLNLLGVARDATTGPPGNIFRFDEMTAIPTNKWYQNLLLHHDGEPSELQRVYTIPYMIDLAGPIPGMQLHPNHMDATSNVIQLSYVILHGLTLGVAKRSDLASTSDKSLTKDYSVLQTTELGITMSWDIIPMSTTLIRGMPYMTMTYPSSSKIAHSLIPTIAATGSVRGDLRIDGTISMPCNSTLPSFQVDRELQVTFDHTDFSWIAFFSHPTMMRCTQEHPSYGGAALQFSPLESDVDLVVRVALITNCTAGRNPLYCRWWDRVSPLPNHDHWISLLRKHASVYPGPNSQVQYQKAKNDDDQSETMLLTLDWDAQHIASMEDKVEDTEPIDLITFALPHHLRSLQVKDKQFCQPVLLGHACILTGSKLTIPQHLPPIGFRALRPPRPEAIPALSRAIEKDFDFQVPDYFLRGTGDTYFSGKILAKVARILIIAEELRELCTEGNSAYIQACKNSTLVDEQKFEEMLQMLRSGVEIWINGTAEAPFVYDKGWGGLINCGCYFNGKTKSCDNKFPDCPAFADQGLNFGNGYYNDHHFHYGYHIYAASVVAKFDPGWGRVQFEGVKLMIRDIANPSPKDKRFPLFRHMDWYEGHSWASGIPLPAYLNGRNQESSSEAIASYEAVAIFGQIMAEAWEDCSDCLDSHEHMQVSKEIRDVGRLLLATEIKSTDQYWHVRLRNENETLYPKPYTQNVVGIIWNTMAQFQTWFGNAPYLPYGIQLLPITPISEYRDDPAWLKEMYTPFANACNEAIGCEKDGWSVLQLAILSSVGHFEKAMQRLGNLSPDVFESAGGNGHSRTNTLWYIATRPDVEPMILPSSELKPIVISNNPEDNKFKLTDCGSPETCTTSVLNNVVSGFTCRDRISWLIQSLGKSQLHACGTIGGLEFPTECGGCSPPGWTPDNEFEDSKNCPVCPDEICNSDLNRCPSFERTFLCIKGPSTGGCQGFPWQEEPQCSECCESTNCPRNVVNVNKKVIDPSVCPPCAPDVCKKSLCPANIAPYYCTAGRAHGGCAPRGWDLDAGDCTECCTVLPDCSK